VQLGTKSSQRAKQGSKIRARFGLFDLHHPSAVYAYDLG
jgi:hypothetical protein